MSGEISSQTDLRGRDRAGPPPVVIVALDGKAIPEAPGPAPERPVVVAPDLGTALAQTPSGAGPVVGLVGTAADMLAAALATAPSVDAALTDWTGRIAAQAQAIRAAGPRAVVLSRAGLHADPQSAAAALAAAGCDLPVAVFAAVSAAAVGRAPEAEAAPFRALAARLVEAEPELRALAADHAALCAGPAAPDPAPRALAEAARSALARMGEALDRLTVEARLAEADRDALRIRADLDHADRRRRDAELAAILLAQGRRADDLRRELETVRAEIDAIRRARSWRLLRPVRALARAWRGS